MATQHRLTPALFLDQYGEAVFARSVRELVTKCGGGRVTKQFIDRRDGATIHNGYVVGARWFTAFRPVEIVQSA